MPPALTKYPRTLPLAGSGGLARGCSWQQLAGLPLTVEEKLDGAHCGICFDSQARMWLFHRGQYLDAEDLGSRLWAPLAGWASAREDQLLEALEDRYVLHGEWMLAKHTVFYDQLPDLFLEYDLYDSQQQVWLDTPARRQRLEQLKLAAVPVLFEGSTAQPQQLEQLAGDSAFISVAWKSRLEQQAQLAGVDPQLALAQSSGGRSMEGLYIKHEQEGQVLARYKWVRPGFLSRLLDSGSHWRSRPLVANQLG